MTPFIFFKDNIACDVNVEFIDLTGFSQKEVLGRSISEIRYILKIPSRFDFENTNREISCYLFNYKNEPIEVLISRFNFSCYNNKIYYFREVKNSKINDIMPFVSKIYHDNEMGVAVYGIHEMHGIILKLNNKFLSLNNMNLVHSNYIGKDLGKVFPQIVFKYHAKITDAITDAKTFSLKEVKCTTPCNKERYLDMNFVPISVNGKVKYIVQIINDATERVVSRNIIEKQKEELEASIDNIKGNLFVQAQYESLKSIIENLEFYIARLSVPDFKFIDINTIAYNFLKELFPEIQSHEYLIGKSILEFLGNLRDDFQYSFYNNKIVHRNISYEKSGKEVSYKYIIQPLYGLNNEVNEIIMIGIDMTEEENARILLENTLKMQDDIYSNISHELKTPINVIFSANQIMDMYINNDMYEKEKFKHYNDSIKQNCYRLIKLINNIVDISKNEVGCFKLNLQNENIVEIIEDIVTYVSDFMKSKKISIIFDTDVEEKIIACDPGLIDRVMLNLLSNAIKFSGPDSCIYVNIKEMEGSVEISVRDEGIGISEENMKSLFNRFYRVDSSLSRNTEGTGIGLAIIKFIVEQHEGKLDVESTLGQGSTFKFQLPVRICDNPSHNDFYKQVDNKIEKINIEFSDIYFNEY